jgi:hypothetical protein
MSYDPNYKQGGTLRDFYRKPSNYSMNSKKGKTVSFSDAPMMNPQFNQSMMNQSLAGSFGHYSMQGPAYMPPVNQRANEDTVKNAVDILLS